jgi:dimethylaniline monooxygenase (N-oxide forming)
MRRKVSFEQHNVRDWLILNVFFKKSNKAIPYISATYRTHSLLNDIRSSILQVLIVDTGDRQIDLAPWLEFVDEKGIVHFRENGGPEAAVTASHLIFSSYLT